MKLLTHNMLACHIKGVKNGFPLKIEAEQVETREVDFEPDFLRHIFPRIQWEALREAATAMGEGGRRGGALVVCCAAALCCLQCRLHTGVQQTTGAGAVAGRVKHPTALRRDAPTDACHEPLSSSLLLRAARGTHRAGHQRRTQGLLHSQRLCCQRWDAASLQATKQPAGAGRRLSHRASTAS